MAISLYLTVASHAVDEAQVQNGQPDWRNITCPRESENLSLRICVTLSSCTAITAVLHQLETLYNASCKL